METSLQRIGLIVLPEFQVMCFAALSVFEVANKEAGRQIYELHVLSEPGGSIPTSFGMMISTEPLDRFDFDTLLIGVGMDIPKTPPGVIEDNTQEKPMTALPLLCSLLNDATDQLPIEIEHRRHVQTAMANERIEGIWLNNPVLEEICEAYVRGEIDAGDLVAVYQKRSQ
jgi:hypothetical protein